jgi:hypothetical protein
MLPAILASLAPKCESRERGRDGRAPSALAWSAAVPAALKQSNEPIWSKAKSRRWAHVSNARLAAAGLATLGRPGRPRSLIEGEGWGDMVLKQLTVGGQIVLAALG